MVEQILDRPCLRETDEPKQPGATSRPAAPGRAVDASTSRTFIIVCLVAGVVAWSRLGCEYVKLLRPHGPLNCDYFQDWASARNYWDGRPVYTPHATTIPMYLGQEPSDWDRQIEYNAHPPVSVLLALPLGHQEFSDATLAWNLVSLTTFLAALMIVATRLPELKTLFLPVAVVLPFCQPIYGTLMNGQLTFLLVLLVTAAWALDRSDRPGFAGVVVGAAAAVKLFPAYLVVYFVARRSWRAILAAAGAFVALNFATAAVLGWLTYRDYLWTVLPSLEKFRSCGFNQSFFGFWHKLFDPAIEQGCVTPLWYCPAVARYGTFLSDLLATLLVAAVAYRARTRDQRDLAFGLALTAMLLVSPITWGYSLPLLLVPLAVVTRTAMTSRWPAALLAPILTVFGLPQGKLIEMVLADTSPHAAMPGLVLSVLSPSFYALLATLGLIAALAWQRPHAGPASP